SARHTPRAPRHSAAARRYPPDAPRARSRRARASRAGVATPTPTTEEGSLGGRRDLGDRGGLEVQLDRDAIDEPILAVLLGFRALHHHGAVAADHVLDLGAVAVDADVDRLRVVVRIAIAERLEAIAIDVDIRRAAARVLLLDLVVGLGQREQRAEQVR